MLVYLEMSALKSSQVLRLASISLPLLVISMPASLRYVFSSQLMMIFSRVLNLSQYSLLFLSFPGLIREYILKIW